MGQLFAYYHSQRTKTQLAALIDAVLPELEGGKTISGWSNLDVSTQKHIYASLDPRSRLALLIWAWALADPVTTDFYKYSVTARTRPVFS